MPVLRSWRPLPIVIAALLALAACSNPTETEVAAAPATTSDSSSSTTTTSTTTAPTTSTSTSTTSTTTAPTTSTTSTTTTTAPTTSTTSTAVVTVEQPTPKPFAVADGVELVLPASAVELIGFHEAGHDGSKQLELLDTSIESVTMQTRGRGTGSRTAADIVVDPDAEIRSPVTGTVIRGGTYVLYCDHSDDFVVIEPDSRPGWEVKMFHFDGLQVVVGERVEAGVTPIAPRATPLPFESQVDEFTATPSNPHVHVEVIDPSIPDIPTPGGGC